MTPREQLEMAAKAAGYEILVKKQAERDAMLGVGNDAGLWIKGVSTCWNPRDDDGQSLRLAVRLNFAVKCNGPDSQHDPDCTIVLFDTVEFPWRLVQKHAGDPEAATRCAIFRAAVKVGLQMLPQKGEG